MNVAIKNKQKIVSVFFLFFFLKKKGFGPSITECNFCGAQDFVKKMKFERVFKIMIDHDGWLVQWMQQLAKLI